MFFKKKDKRSEAEIPGSGMADIAFLLLIFFLVVTTIDVDRGIGMQLPPPPDPDEDPPPIADNNLLPILVNQQGQILLDEEPAALGEVQERVIEFVDNANRAQDPELSDDPRSAVISIQTHRQTPYDVYIDMLDEVIGAYRILRDQAAQELGFDSYEDYEERLPEGAENEVEERYPKNISIAEPDPGN